jgi:ADP-L-glycero-D-manno-heptose 6-epimerase
VRGHEGSSALDLPALVAAGMIEYFPMPEDLVGRYQHYTEADLDQLREAGYRGAFRDVERGVGEYVRDLLSEAGAGRANP